MSLDSSTSRNNYIGTNATASYDYTFRIIQNSDLTVTVRNTSDVESTLFLDSDYTVSGAGDASGGSITLLGGNLATGYALSIRRVIDVTQTTDIRNQGEYFPELHEDAFDKLTMIAQQHQDDLDRSLKLAETIDPADFDATIPAGFVGASGKLLITDADGDGWDVGPDAGQIAAAQSYAVAAAASAATAMTYANALNVKAFGAIGDGSTDDTVAIQAALTAAGALGGGTVLIPEGIFKTTAQLTWPDVSNVQLQGSGPGASTLKFAWGGASSTTAFGILINSATTLSGVKISNLAMQGSAADSTAIYELIQIRDGISDIRLENLDLKWARHAALRLTSSSAGSRVWIDNCNIHDINSGTMTGISGGAILGNFDKTHVSNCTFTTIGNSSSFHAVYFDNRTDAVISNCFFKGDNCNIHFFGSGSTNAVINGCTFNAVFPGIVFFSVTGGSITGNLFYNSSLEIASDGMLVQGNTFLKTTGDNFSCIYTGASCAKSSFLANHFNDTSGSTSNTGILGDNTGSADWMVSGNTFLNFAHAMNLKGDRMVIKGNNISTTSSGEQIWFKGGTGHVAIDNYLLTADGGRAVFNESAGIAIIKGNTLLGNGLEGGTAGGVPSIGMPYATTGTRAVAANRTLTMNDSILLVDASGGARTITLPALSTSLNKEFIIKRINATNSVIISRAGSDTIDGATTKTITTQYGVVRLVAGPTEWNVLATLGTVT